MKPRVLVRLAAPIVVLAVLMSVRMAAAEIFVLRSGYVGGAPAADGTADDDITCIFAEECCVALRNAAFTSTDFADARNGSDAVVVSDGAWVSSLVSDGDARWVNSSIDFSTIPPRPAARSALYAMPFDIASASVDSVCLEFRWASDCTLGDPIGGPNPIGVYVNETPLDASFSAGGFGGQTIAAADITSLVSPGANTLYVYVRDAGGSISGLLFSAIVKVNDCDSLFITDPCDSTCLSPLGDMRAWWPLDETSGHQAQEVIYGNDGANFTAIPVLGWVKAALEFDGIDDQVSVNDAATINVAFNDFSIDAWVLASDTTGTRTIVDKVNPTTMTGYSFFLREGRFGLSMADGTRTDYWSIAGPVVPAGAWHHVAVTVDHTKGVILFWLDGLNVDGAVITTTGSLNSAPQPLLIGAANSTGGPTDVFHGRIDEVEFFDRMLTLDEVERLYKHGVCGKCKETCHIPWDVLVTEGSSSVEVTIDVCNWTEDPQEYNMSFTGLPAGSVGGGGGCTINGPSTFTILSPTPPISVPAKSCVPVQVSITVPSGLTAGEIACYKVTVTNDATGYAFDCIGSLEGSNIFQARPLASSKSVEFCGSTQVAFLLKNVSPVPRTVAYEFAAMSSDMDMTNQVVSLNAFPPGQHVPGSVFLAPGDSAVLSVNASLRQFQPLRFSDVLLLADYAETGTKGPIASTGLRSVDLIVPPGSCIADESGVGPSVVPIDGRVVVNPNPSNRESEINFSLHAPSRVTVSIYDVSGALVRQLIDERRGMGYQRIVWDGRDASGQLRSGVFLVRVHSAAGVIGTKIVRVR